MIRRNLNAGRGRIVIAALALMVGKVCWSAPTRVGNGDDGSDLEGSVEVREGVILEARDAAVALLRRMNTAGIAGLGLLLPEVESAKLYVARKDVAAASPSDQGSFHSDIRGHVYARTFAEPHASSRFFPIALKLDRDQMIALQIHEALHRSLDPSVREDESVVSHLTLAITSPEATHDEIAQSAKSVLPDETRSGQADAYPIPADARIRQPSTIGYSYRRFQGASPAQGPALFPVESMHVLQSYLYPFGSDRVPLGIGIEASFIGRSQRLQAGPLGLSARLRLWSGRGFDVGAYASAALNTLSNDELKNSPIGRDVATAGVVMAKDFNHGYVENSVSLSTSGKTREKIGAVDNTYEFGEVVQGTVRAGAKYSKLRIGGFADVILGDYFRVVTINDRIDSGRYRVFSGGPEVSWTEKDFAFGLSGRYLLDSTRNANFDYLGNILGQGAAQGSVTGNVSLFF